jgi:hypothetical protein
MEINISHRVTLNFEPSTFSVLTVSLLSSPSGAALAVTSVPSENCGIVGVVGGEDAVGFLLEGLTILRNRGYDSAGVASVGVVGTEPAAGTQLLVTKYASRDSTCDSIDLVRAHSARHAGDAVVNNHGSISTFRPSVCLCHTAGDITGSRGVVVRELNDTSPTICLMLILFALRLR